MAATLIPMNELERLAELYQHAILDTPPETLFDQITQMAAQACGVPIALISLVDRERQWFKSKIGLDVAETPREAAFCAHTILGSEPMLVADATQDPRFADNPLVTGDPAIRFYAGVPLRTVRGYSLGTLCVVDRQPRTLSPVQLGTLKLLALQVVQQLELRRVAELLRRESSLLDKTQQVAAIGGWELDLRTNLLSWTDETYRLHGVRRDDYAPTMESAISFYSPESLPAIQDAVRHCLSAGKSYDLELQVIRADGARRWFRTTGMREVQNEKPQRLYGVFQDITSRREMENEIVLIAQREQARIGSDLHDGLGQQLTGITLFLRALTARVPASFDDLRADLDNLEKLAVDALKSCRALAQGLSPTATERGGLVAALRRHAESVARIHGIEVTFESRGRTCMADAYSADHLFRIAQEAMTNAIKHGPASKIILSLESTTNHTRVCISDDGCGFEDDGQGEGIGLRIMHYRARLIHATLEVQRNDCGGAQVACLLPHEGRGEQELTETTKPRRRRQRR